MGKADNPVGLAGQSSAELLIVGGGVMGLWAAVHAERMGIDTILIDAGRLGQGTSGGVLGALMPHMPDRWEEKKQFQLEALVSLETEIARLEVATGISAGYRRSGRLIPLPKPHLRTIALGHSEDAETHWHHDGRRFHWNVVNEPVAGWLDPAAGEHGFVHDTLAARVSPRGLIGCFQVFLGSARHVRVAEGVAVDSIDPARGIAGTSEGTIGFGHCILSSGHAAFPMLDGLTANLAKPLGQPVKGQAALLRADVDAGLPVIFRDGLYVVPHEGGLVAVGSTSENRYEEALSTDGQLDALIAAARAIVPVLAEAEVVERWAGLRPKAIDRHPMVGVHPEHEKLIALTGGFKVSFGLAHRLAAIAIGGIVGSDGTAAKLPQGFALAHHIGVASRKT